MKIFQLIHKSQVRGAVSFANQLSTHLEAMYYNCLMIIFYGGNAQLPFTRKIVHLMRPIKRRW